VLTVATLVPIGKIALVAFLVGACGFILATYLRKRPAGGARPLADPNAQGYLALYRGSAAPALKPEQVVEVSELWDGDPDGGTSRRWL
jgi:hypothetical protein